MKHGFENSKNIYYTIKVISTNKNTEFSIFFQVQQVIECLFKSNIL